MPATLPLRHFLLALAVVAVWGTNFVVIKLALGHLPPLLFAALRFGLVLFPALFFLARPAVPLGNLVLYGLLIGVGQFGLLYVAMNGHISPGLSLTHWEEDATQRAALRTMVSGLLTMPSLPPLGLMTMAPWDAPPDEIRAVFRRCRALAEWLAGELPALPRPALSMGMTDDFEIAIEEGATHVRVGRALFGEREATNETTRG